MPFAEWDDAKNAELRRTRGVSFEDVVDAIDSRQVLSDEPDPHAARYPDQRILVVLIDGYAHVVPYVPGDGRIFLKTIFPSRRVQRRLVGGRDAKREA